MDETTQRPPGPAAPPPPGDGAPRREGPKLFSPGSVAIATLLGSAFIRNLKSLADSPGAVSSPDATLRDR